MTREPRCQAGQSYYIRSMDEYIVYRCENAGRNACEGARLCDRHLASFWHRRNLLKVKPRKAVRHGSTSTVKMRKIRADQKHLLGRHWAK